MNKVQKKYALVKAKYEAIKAEQDKEETTFVQKSGYVRSDGIIPLRLWMIDDEEKFEELSKAFDASPQNHFQELRQAEEELCKAEDELIKWGISIVPFNIRQVLKDNLNQYKVRGKLVDLTFRLNI